MQYIFICLGMDPCYEQDQEPGERSQLQLQSVPHWHWIRQLGDWWGKDSPIAGQTNTQTKMYLDKQTDGQNNEYTKLSCSIIKRAKITISPFHLLYPVMLPPTGWKNWPLDKFNVSKLNWWHNLLTSIGGYRHFTLQSSIFLKMFKVIGRELYQNLGLSLLCVFLTTLVLLASLQGCVLVLLSVLITLVSFYSYNKIWNTKTVCLAFYAHNYFFYFLGRCWWFYAFLGPDNWCHLVYKPCHCCWSCGGLQRSYCTCFSYTDR